MPITGTGRALQRMVSRDPYESGRVASPLELFFDLVFVVAVSLSSQQLHHLDADGEVWAGLLSYLMVFFAIWWAWMNFTWFATSFDTDDWLYRVMTIVQMAGVLILAAGAEAAMTRSDFTLVTIGYLVMRLAMVTQWFRAGLSDAGLRGTAFRYAGGIVVVQLGWVVRLVLPDLAGFVGFFVLAVAEIAVPVWAESHKTTAWNAHHIGDRYGAFTLIVLGESVLASTNAVVEAVAGGDHLRDLLVISAAGLVIAAGLWWVYFAREHHEQISDLRSSLRFGYFHYVIFAAAGAFSAGIEVTIDTVGDHTRLTSISAGATLSVPVAIFLLGVWWLTLRRGLTAAGNACFLVGALVAGCAAVLGGLSTAIVTAAGVVVAVVATETMGQSHSVPPSENAMTTRG
ncbi:putative low temperature requirement protein A [Microlunatus endophyticus]|uniref:Low temperature requirement protein A n=1 Tax=Microlunatus endophyticus TaxID=1716077 RepID=A0A917S6E6_9ACTN|nr:low temperature requirement protein A [Microlunatus endophyticus]GGL61195.1 putative low temperature requirement protein A [Microlunatus endophyticus]